MLLYHFDEPPPRHRRVFFLFYISLLQAPPHPPTPSLLDPHMDSNRHTNTPSGSCTYSPSDRENWSPPTQKRTKTLLIFPPVVVDTGYVSLHNNFVLQLACGKICVTDCVCACMSLRACATFFLGEMCECVYLFRYLCACVFVFETSNVSEISQPCFIQ